MPEISVSRVGEGVNSTDQRPPSNRGATGDNREENEKGVSCCIDWLRYSVAWPTDRSEGLPLVAFTTAVMRLEALRMTGEVITPPRGYDTALRLSWGTLRYHTEQVKQKIGVEFTGRDLAELRAADVDLLAYLGWVVRQPAAKVTRLDLALDIHGEDADPGALYAAWERGDLVTPAHDVERIETKSRLDGELRSKGQTVYIGSRFTSNRFLRVYDKALEQGQVGQKWTRIELVLADDRATVMAALLAAEPDKFVDRVRSEIRAFCTAKSVGWYMAALEGPAMTTTRIERRKTDRREWLLKMVLPALKKDMYEAALLGDYELYREFKSALQIYETHVSGQARSSLSRDRGHR